MKRRFALIDHRGESIDVYSFDGGSAVRTGTLGENGGPVSSKAAATEAPSAASCLSLPLSMLDFRILEMPFSDMKKNLELIPVQLDPFIIGGASSVVFDAVSLGAASGKERVLVVYIAKTVLRKILGVLSGAGYCPGMIVSLELRHLLSANASAEGFAERLLSYSQPSEKERIRLFVGETGNHLIDLAQGEFSNRADSASAAKHLRTAAFLTVALILVLLARAAYISAAAGREAAEIRDDIRKTYQSVFPEEKKITDEAYQLKAHIREFREKADFFSGASSLEVLMRLAKTERPGTSFSEIAAERELIIFKGEGPTLSEVQKTKNELERYFTGIEISDTKPSLTGRTMFTITAKGLAK